MASIWPRPHICKFDDCAVTMEVRCMPSSRRVYKPLPLLSLQAGPLSDGEECNNELTQLAAETVLIIHN